MGGEWWRFANFNDGIGPDLKKFQEFSFAGNYRISGIYGSSKDILTEK
jgi:hypothetical protein